jgi:hypothetical protein
LSHLGRAARAPTSMGHFYGENPTNSEYDTTQYITASQQEGRKRILAEFNHLDADEASPIRNPFSRYKRRSSIAIVSHSRSLSSPRSSVSQPTATSSLKPTLSSPKSTHPSPPASNSATASAQSCYAFASKSTTKRTPYRSMRTHSRSISTSAFILQTNTTFGANETAC